jgi:hypothetical protein
MINKRSRLQASACVSTRLFESNIRNHLFIRIAPQKTRHRSTHLTFIGLNSSSYAAIAALLVASSSTTIELIQLFDISGEQEARVNLHDLQSIVSLNKTNVRLEWVHSYWQTKNSTIIVINVQHNRLGKKIVDDIEHDRIYF